MLETIIMSILLLIVGFLLLVKGADVFVEGSASVAKRLHVPPLIIGMTIVAMGTSLPECSVSIIASLSGNNTLSISNVVGSNIFNLMVVCGACTLFVPLAVNKMTVKFDFPISIACAALLLGFGYSSMTLGRAEGITTLAFFAVFISYMIILSLKSMKAGQEVEVDGEDLKVIPVWKSIVFIIFGIIAIKFGGDFVVGGATKIATLAGISETLIGLTIVATGTSLPELVTSIVATRKNQVDMAIGNVVGSNIFNILLILGITATISPIALIQENIIDIVVLIVFSVIVWLFAWTKKKLSRKEGITMLIMYAAYLAYICMR